MGHMHEAVKQMASDELDAEIIRCEERGDGRAGVFILQMGILDYDFINHEFRKSP